MDVVALSELLGYIIGVGLPLLGWGIKLTWDILCIKADNRELLVMHREPDKYGFGTGETNRTLADSHRQLNLCIDGNTAVVRELIHYIKWSFKEKTGNELPPPIVDEVK